MSLDSKKIYSLLGLAVKSGNLASGEFMTEKTVKGKKAALVIVSEDASDNTRKMFLNMCAFYKVPIYIFGNRDQIGHAMGKGQRVCLAVTDAGLAGAIRKQLDTETEMRRR